MNAILTLAIGDCPHYAITIPRLAAFANFAKVDFIVRSGTGPESKDHKWKKIEALQELSEKYDRVLYIDSDFMPNTNLLKKQDIDILWESGIGMVVDQGVKVTDHEFVDWCHESMDTTVPVGSPYYNTGLMSLGRLEINCLYDYWMEKKPVKTKRFQDQDFINWWLWVMGIEPLQLSEYYNWMAPQFIISSLQTAKLIHCAGKERTMIEIYDKLLPYKFNP